MKRLIFPAIALLLVLLFSLLPTPQEKQDSLDERLSSLNGDFVITNVRLYDGFKIIENAQLVVRNNKVEYIGEKTRRVTDLPVISGQGFTLLPGLIDAHTHNWGDASKEALNFGVATELDMFTAPESAKPHFAVRDSSANIAQADLFSATVLATAPDGHGTQFGIKIPVLTAVEQVPEFVRMRLADGADYIKAVYSSTDAPRQYLPSISLEILQALVTETHKHNRQLLVHINDLISAKEAIRAGADGLIHAFMDAPADDELIDLMRENNAFITPTLTVLATMARQGPGKALLENPKVNPYLTAAQIGNLESGFPDIGISDKGYINAEYSIQRLHEAGVTVLAGSDAPNPGTTHGASLHEELLRLVSAGLTPEAAIHASTGAVGRVMPIIADRGTLQKGSAATMLLVQGNPFEEITATQDIVAIWKHGQRLTRQNRNDSASNQNPVIEPMLISDFENEIDENRLVVTTDALLSGNSTAQMRIAAEGTNHYLDFKGELKSGYMFPWTGLSVALTNTAGQVVDLSKVSSLNFRAKVYQGESTLQLLLIQNGRQQPATHAITISDQWTNYSIPLTAIDTVDRRQIVNLSLVFMGEIGMYNLQIDDIGLD